MRKIYLLLSFFVSLYVFAQTKTFELRGISGKDTVNVTDALGKKQGKWVVKSKHRQNTCFSAEQKLEEGMYVDNRKVGRWFEYYCNGNLRSLIHFQNGKPDGYAIMYHENGKISEEGIWKNNRWTGPYKLYYENGQPQHEFNFNTNGKREGPVKYFYENGQLALEGNFVNGKEAGEIREYHENGDLKAKKTFNDGVVDVASIKEFEVKKPMPKVKDDTIDKTPKVVLKEDEKPNNVVTKGPIILNGQHITYNKNKQISKDGIFKNNQLMEGKSYVYDEDGILQRISVYKNGHYVGDAPIEK